MIQKPALIWTVPNLFDDVIDWTSTRLHAALGGKRKQPETIELTDEQAWQTEFSAPVKTASDLKAALLQTLPTLSPIPLDQAVFYASPTGDTSSVNLLVLRTEIDADFQKSDPHADGFSKGGQVFRFKREMDQTRRRAGLAAGLLLGSLLLADFGLGRLNTQSEARLAELRGEERTIRAEMKNRTDAARQQTALERFMASEPERLTPSARLNLLNQLSEATPDSTYWTELGIAENFVRIEARSLDAARDLATTQEALSTWTISLDGPISAVEDNRQSMTLRLQPAATMEPTQ